MSPEWHPSHFHAFRLSGVGGKAVPVNTTHPLLVTPGQELLLKTGQDGVVGPTEVLAMNGNLGIFPLRERKNGRNALL